LCRGKSGGASSPGSQNRELRRALVVRHWTGRGADMSVAVGGGRREFSAEYRWAGYLLGFAIGGFFDGILLHQILQWHHLLSGLGDGGPGDLRFQILADGLFHLMMYVL